jgi:hypothetical protein
MAPRVTLSGGKGGVSNDVFRPVRCQENETPFEDVLADLGERLPP